MFINFWQQHGGTKVSRAIQSYRSGRPPTDTYFITHTTNYSLQCVNRYGSALLYLINSLAMASGTRASLVHQHRSGRVYVRDQVDVDVDEAGALAGQSSLVQIRGKAMGCARALAQHPHRCQLSVHLGKQGWGPTSATLLPECAPRETKRGQNTTT